MDRIELVIPKMEHKGAAEGFKKEFFACGEGIIHGSALLDKMEYAAWLENLLKNSDPKTARPDWVQASTFFAARAGDGRIAGIIDIRHNLEHPFLSEYGGHIGYSVRPSERQKGFATDMLRQALGFTRRLGLSKVMLGCFSDNLASKRTIEKCGGKLTQEKPYFDGRMTSIYWIPLSCADF